MTYVCSVILIRRSFDIYHEQQKISLHNESILLLEKNLADDFAFCSPDTRRLDIDELTVCHYLQNIRQLPRNLGLHSKDRLLINQSPPMPLVTAIFDSFNESGVNSPILSNMLYLSCLSMFSHKKELIPLHTIAEKCGYSSTSYFINTFRQYYGVTPHQFAQHSPGTFS
ncbi:TPA: AraC family transcriptional regulator [Shigella flexneri]